MKRNMLLLAALAALIVMGSAGATGTLDQSQTSASAGFDALTTQAARLGQTFTAGLTGSLDQVDLFLVRNGSPGDLTVAIEASAGGIPAGMVLATATVAESSLALDVPAWLPVPFSIPAVSIAGTQYAIVISAHGVDCGHVCYQWGAALGDPYAGGEAVDSIDGGTTWFSPGTGIDRAFNTYVTPSPDHGDHGHGPRGH
jgi:hypothetical protein